MKKSKTGYLVFLKRLMGIHFFKVMRVTVFLILLGVSNVFASSTYSQSTKFTFHLRNISLEQLFEEIQDNSEFNIFYKNSQVDRNLRVDITANEAFVESILTQAMEGTDLDFKVIDRQIVIFQKKSLPEDAKPKELDQAPPPQKTVSGKVTDSNGHTLPGVTVVVVGSTIGTVTNMDGQFSLAVPNDAKMLKFSFVGMKTQELEIGNKTVFNVILKEEAIGLEEVVAVGYGVQNKREIVGSISKIGSEDIEGKQIVSFEQALQGQAAGVNVTQGTGMAGSGSVVRIRGIASINASGDPLYVIDGIPISQDMFGLNATTWGMNPNPLASINPNDIESIEVLKDAAACGIYGSRGANGVIIITTKKAKNSQLKIDFSTKHSLSTSAKDPNVVGTEDWMQLYQEAWENDGNTGVPQNLPGNLTWEQAKRNDTDWWKEITHAGYSQEYNLSASFGITEKLKAYISGSHNNNESYIKRNAFKRYNGKLNLNYTLSPKFTITASTMLANTKTDLVGDPWSGGTGAAMGTALPIYPIKNEDGTYFKGAGNDANPVMVSKLQDVFNDETRTINSLSINYAPIKKLSFTFSGAIDYLKFFNEGFQDKYLRSVDGDYAWKSKTNIFNYNYNAVGTYNTNIRENEIVFMLGNEMQYSKTTGERNEYDYDPESTNPKNLIDYGTQEWRFLSFFGRLNYKYKDRYIVQTSLRFDGSSRFGANNKFGTFPTLAFGWIASEEEFVKNIINEDVLSFLKLKASYGYTGNSNIPNYEHLGTYITPTNNSSYYNDMPVRYPSRYSNPDLKWEITKNLDLAAEAQFWGGRVAAEVAYFLKNSEDVFINVSISQTTGFRDQWKNIAKIRNEGLEFNITTRNFVGHSAQDFKWTTKFNISTIDNEVTDLGGLTSEEIGGGANDTRILLGYPIGTMRMVRFSRIDPEDGRPIYLDRDGNETKTYIFAGENGYAKPAGKLIPDFTGGITNTFEYKGFSLSTLFIFSYGAKLYDAAAKRQMTLMSNWNFRTDGFDRWQQPGDDAKYPRLTLDGNNWGASEQWFNTSMWIYDASYIRLKNLSFAYDIPSKFLSKFKLSSARISLTGTNLLTFTNFPGIDPEVARDFNDARDRNMSPNATYLTVPQAKTYTLGLNVSF
ncbi:SusC/RagA family TonB-linked outer membrane protein [Maribellus luteus]|uniref:SusC/RagA family TonB-linked outer membrane protein n=1 Tax=Maribellus luteus TaxID=2305463 RepID=A0A399SQL4_9BACT|nr:TonB-dependent receptor [Maribellus luteus]RIJ45658.1 SusC/RagA family TonB-linked outer membrane protein [Maribellus luteus]